MCGGEVDSSWIGNNLEDPSWSVAIQELSEFGMRIPNRKFW